MHLVGITAIAEMFGVTKQRVSQIVSDPKSKFPKSLDTPAPGETYEPLASGPVWKATVVERWKAKHRP